jgi:acyl carrier protein
MLFEISCRRLKDIKNILKGEKQMELQEILELLEEVMDIEEGLLTPESELAEVDEWDSLSKLALMAEVKKRVNRRLSTEEILNFKTVQDIIDYLQ